MKKQYSLILLVSVLFFGAETARAQMLGDCVFLQGTYVEVGISPTGSFGAPLLPPAGYHATGTQTLTDPGTGVSTTGLLLGFVADPDMDGWAVGTPYTHYGDYFLPGDPQEGWAITVNGVESDAYTPGMSFGSPYTGTLSGTSVSYNSVGTTRVGVWQGQTTDPLQITQTTTLYTDKLYFTVHVKIKNTGSAVANNVYYLRTVDPDNAEPEDGSFTTSNTIAYQLPNANNDVMVTAVDPTYSQAFLGLGTRDCRAKCFIIGPFGGLTPSYTLDALWDESSGYIYGVGTNDVNDEGIGLVYKLGNIAAGDSTDLTYAYVLRGADLDSALAITSPNVYAAGAALVAGSDTLNGCSSLTDTLPVSITSGDSYTWTWAPATGLTSTTGTSSSVILSEITVATTYTLVGVPLSGALCANDTFKFTVLPGVSLPPVVTNVSYCLNVPSVPLTATGSNLMWYTSATAPLGSSTAPTPSTAVAGTFTWWVTQHSGSCLESIRMPITVTVTNPPSVTPSSNGPVCQGLTLNLFASDTVTMGVPTFTWIGPGGFTSTSQNPSIGGVPVSATGTYSVVINVNGCVDTSITSVIINPNPVITGTGFNTPSQCRFQDGALEIAGLSLGETYVTHFTIGGITVTGLGTVNPATDSLKISNDSAGTYNNVYVTDTNGCVSNTVTIFVSDGVKPPAPTLSSNGPICQDSVLMLYATDTALNISYSWVGPSAFSSTQENPVINPASASTIGVYTCTIKKNVTGCVPLPSTIIVNFKPTPVVDIATAHSVCLHDTLTFSSSGPSYPGATYYWTLPVATSVAVGSLTTPTVGVVFDSSFHHQVILTVSLNGCTNWDTTGVYVVPTPALGLYVAPDICVGDTTAVALTTTSYSPVIGHYDWNFDGGSIATAAAGTGGPYSVYWSTPGLHVVQVTGYTLQSVCASITQFDTINVHPLPDASFTGSGPACTGDSILLTATTSVAGYSYTWAPAAFFSGTLNSPTAYCTVLIPSNVSLTVSDPYGCTAIDSVYFDPSSCCDVIYPLAFSPNGDGHNDRLRAITTGHHQLNIFRVVNRWGTTVYENVNSDSDGWDGTYNGVPQDVDTYYWYIKYTCGGKTYEKNGDVILVR